MNHWLVAPVIVPAVLGPLIVLWMRHDLVLQRVFSVAGSAALVAVSIWLAWLAGSGEIIVYRMGNWAAPFGITLVLDRLAAMMLLLTAILALVVQLYSIGAGWDRKGWHFHALWQFQLMGINGAFLTGDAFNLFVFFEVLLIASYGLMIHGGGQMRLRAGLQYVIYNLVGSVLFLAALGTLYAVTGTLNLADMAERVTMLPPTETALLRTGAVLLMLVFAVKAALVPLHFWLPSTYADAPGPVAALFAIMTKVGVYGIIRFFTLVFPQGGTSSGTLVSDLLLPAAVLTLVAGQIGVLGGRNLSRVAAWATIGSVGTLMIAVAPFGPVTTAAALWYLPHSALASAALFLITDLIIARRGGDGWLHPLPPLAQSGLIAALFFAVAIAVAGLPPLSGFPGKLLVMDAFTGHSWQWWVWGFILVTSLLTMVGFIRAGSMVFWKSYELAPVPPSPQPATHPNRPRLEPDEVGALAGESTSPGLAVVSAGMLLALLVFMVLAAGPLAAAAEATAAQLHEPAQYIDAVFRNQGAVK